MHWDGTFGHKTRMLEVLTRRENLRPGEVTPLIVDWLYHSFLTAFGPALETPSKPNSLAIRVIGSTSVYASFG